MKLYGKYDENLGDMGDFTDKVYIPLDFNTAAPLLQRKPAKFYSICEGSFEKLLKLFKERLTKKDSNRDLLISMRVKHNKTMNAQKVTKMGWKISEIMGKDSLVTWAAQGYNKYRFDFYFYDSPKIYIKRKRIYIK